MKLSQGHADTEPRLTRRETLAVAAALFPASLLGCSGREVMEATGKPTDVDMRFDGTFAELALQLSEQGGDRLRERLLVHPALDALLRHRKMSGDPNDTRERLLERVLRVQVDHEGAQRVLSSWTGRTPSLSRAAGAALPFLPPGSSFHGRIFAVVGYDLGIAAPPDVAVNVGHEHFVSAPSEVSHYVTHEAHHVGFLSYRRAPELVGLERPDRLAQVIQFFTQMEGMAVHAAYPPRHASGAVGADDDYRIYTDAGFAQEVRDRYRQVVSRVKDAKELGDEEIGQVLNAMSSGDRLWYRWGAFVSWSMENDLGRDALVGTVTNGEAFHRYAAKLLAS